MPQNYGEKRKKDGRLIRYTTIKARLYPTQEQVELFEKTFGCCRYIWNRMLSDEQTFYAATDKHFIPTPAKYKKEAPFLKEVDNQALIQEHVKLSQAFRVFFRSPETFGYPKFKDKKKDKDSFTACNHTFPSGDTIYTTKDGIRMTKAGVVKAVFPRRPRSSWKLKRITVEKTKSGKYYCCILYEYTVKEPEPVEPADDSTVGLKYSLPHFYVTDTGETADSPHWMAESCEKLKKLQRRMCRMQPGSKNYREAVRKYRELNEHIANQRRDYIQKESRRLADEWDAVCVRADDMDAVSRAVTLGNVMDSGFGAFRECLKYKLAQQGKQLIMVDRLFPSSRICNNCGYTMPEAPSYKRRTWECPVCGKEHNREVNAARNIKARGLAQIENKERS